MILLIIKNKYEYFTIDNYYKKDDYEEAVPVRISGNISIFNNIRILKEY